MSLKHAEKDKTAMLPWYVAAQYHCITNEICTRVTLVRYRFTLSSYTLSSLGECYRALSAIV